MHDVSIVFRVVSILLYYAACCKCNVLSVYCCIVPLNIVSATYCECIVVLCHVLYCCIVGVLLYCAAPRFEAGEVTTGGQALSSICQNTEVDSI